MLFSLLTDKEQKQSSRNRCGTDIAESGKKSTLLTILLLAVNCSLIIAQSPQAFKYQAVVRDTGGLLIANQAISIRAAIVADNPNGTIVYQETHSVNSNEFGLINLEIGSGTAMIGAFETIDWSSGPYFTKIEMDETGGSDYELLSEAEILSVPYALYAGQAPGDNLGDHVASQNIALNGNWLSADSANNGIYIANNGSIGAGTSSIDSSAILELSGTSRGFLLPRMTNAQIAGIANPSIGLQVYSLDDSCVHIYSGTAWKSNCAYINSFEPFPASSSWAEKSNISGSPREFPVGFSINGKGYMGTGEYIGTYLSDFWEYNANADVWTQKADFGGLARSNAVGFSISGKGYIGMGYPSYFEDFWEYDPVSNTWAQIADFGGGRRVDAFAITINGKGYVGTGRDNSSTMRNDFWEYDPSTDSWTQKADYGGSPQVWAVGFSIGNKGYAGIGLGASPLREFWEYNPSTDVWVQKSSYPGMAFNNVEGFAISDKGYIGLGWSGTTATDFWEYDPVTDGWTAVESFPGLGRIRFFSFAIENKGYLGMGYGAAGFNDPTKYTDDFWEFNPFPSGDFVQTVATDGTAAWLPYSNTISNDNDPANELQDISLSGTDLTITSGSTVNLAVLQDGTTDADADPANELNTDLQLSGTTLQLTDANGTLSVNLSGLQDGTTDADADSTNELIDSIALDNFMLHLYENGNSKNVDLSHLGTNNFANLDTNLVNPIVHAGSFGVSQPKSVVVRDSYAYFANDGDNKLTIVNIENPATPTLVGELSIGLQPKSIFLLGEYVYIANSGNDKLEIIDISNPAAPSLAGDLALGSHPTNVVVQNGYAYISNEGSEFLEVVDVSNPAVPLLAGQEHIDAFPKNIFIQGSYIYFADYDFSRLSVIDISIPDTPAYVATLGLAGFPTGIFAKGNYAYMVTETNSNLDVIDISNPASPSNVGGVAIGGAPVDVFVQGNYAFIANNGTDKLQVVDISNPTAPLLVGDINIGTFPENVFVQGNYAYITNAGNNELEIIDVSEFAEQAGVAVAVNATGATVLYPITWQAIGNDAYNLNSGNIGIGVVHPTEKLSVAGVIESTTGGIKFPDGTTQTTSATAATNDNLGNHTATQNLQLSGYWLSGDGGDEGIYINNNGNVGIGTATPEVPLHIETANDASLSDGAGILMLGDQGGANIIMDANEMMARNNGSAATLYLNFDGGNVRVGNTSSAVSVDGNLGIGTTSPAHKLHVEGPSTLMEANSPSGWGHNFLRTGGESAFAAAHAGGYGAYIYSSQNSSSIYALRCLSPAGELFNVRSNGNVGIGTAGPSHLLHVNGVARSTQSTWATSSDGRVKENIQNIDNALSLISQFRPVTFGWSADYKAANANLKEMNYGFISQEVEQIIPEMVTEVEETFGENTIEDFRVLNTDALIPLLVKAVQELKAENESLKAQSSKVQALEAELEAIKAALNLDEQAEK